MFFSFFLGVILVIGIVLCLAVIGVNAKKITSGDAYSNTGKLKGKNRVAGIIAIALLLVLIIVPASIRTVDAGTIAVVKEFGKPVDTRTSGIYFDFWLTREYVTYDLTVQQEDIKAAAYSSDAQTMEIRYTAITGNVSVSSISSIITAISSTSQTVYSLFR